MNVTGPGLRFRVIWVLLKLILKVILVPFEHAGVELGGLVAKTVHRQLPREFRVAVGRHSVPKLTPEWGHFFHKLSFGAIIFDDYFTPRSFEG